MSKSDYFNPFRVEENLTQGGAHGAYPGLLYFTPLA